MCGIRSPACVMLSAMKVEKTSEKSKLLRSVDLSPARVTTGSGAGVFEARSTEPARRF